MAKGPRLKNTFCRNNYTIEDFIVAPYIHTSTAYKESGENKDFALCKLENERFMSLKKETLCHVRANG